MMNEERQKKIEAGKLKLAEFQRKSLRKPKSRLSPQKSEHLQLCEQTSLENMGDKLEDGLSITVKENSVNTMEEDSKNSIPTKDSALQLSDEGSEDTDVMLDTKQAMLVSCLEQKVEKYRNSNKQKDFMIQQLSSQLASAMSSNEAVNLQNSKVVENLKAEIDMLHLQVKEASEMIEKQKPKSENRENDQVKETEYVEMHKKSSDCDNFSEDNLMLEESPLSCISLLSLTDSEYKTEYITDSETNSTPKLFTIPRPLQDGDFCIECERQFEIMKNKHEGHICYLKNDIETNLIIEKEEAIKKLSVKIQETELENQNLQSEIIKQTELLCKEHESKIQGLICEQQKHMNKFQNCLSKWNTEKNELVINIRDLEEKLTLKNKELCKVLNEKANIEFSLQKQIADLVEEHKEDLEARNLTKFEQFSQEKKRIENEHASSLEVLKKLHEEELDNLQKALTKEFQEREQCLRKEHSDAILSMEATHFEECKTYQKKIDQLLEEKCELLSKTTEEYETILKKNHEVLVSLCNQLRCKLFSCKKKLMNESSKSVNCDLEVSFTYAFDELNESIEKGILTFLNQKYFDENVCEKMEYISPLSSQINSCVPEDDLLKNVNSSSDKQEHTDNGNEQTQGSETCLSDMALSETSLKSEDLRMIQAEAKKLQVEFQKDVAVYMEVNEQLHKELQTLQGHVKELEDHKKRLELQLLEKEKELSIKKGNGPSVDGCLKGCLAGSQLSSSDIKSWQVDVAQTNSRLLHVLSDMVQTFFDIEQDINRHLCEHGLIPLRSGTSGLHEDETNHSVGSKEDFASLSFGECPNIELAEDGPDLTPRTWDMFSAVGIYENEMEGEDVVLGASRRLRTAVDHVLNLLTRALDNQQNQDLKLLLKRNEELSQELQEESKGRDAVHMELITAESTIRKLESEKQKLNDMISDLKDHQESLKREINIEKNKVNFLTREKENANDEIETLRNQCELLASRLGDPEKIETNKMNSAVSHVNEKPELLQENSRLSTEKHNVQINLSKERQSFLDRLQQMEMALDDLNAEKDEIMENKCKEIRDLKAEMEAMEKQLISNKKFIEEQAQERELEREDYLKELNKMQEVVREKEKIQSNEEQLTKEIDSLEQLLRARIEDHQIAMQKKDAIESDLRQSVDKIRDLHEVIEELEKQLTIKSKIEAELRQKLSSLAETITDQERRNSFLDEEINLARKEHSVGDSTEQVQNLKEQLACQTQEIEEMSQNQTLLQELRGQIHFLEAKVDQRAKQLEIMRFSSNSPILSADTSPSSQDTESLQLPCEDGVEMSPRSIHWLEIRRLEEKIGRLVHIDEELIKKNKELEHTLKSLQLIQTEYEQENAVLQEKLSEQLMQVSALRSFIDEQKHRNATTHNSLAANQKINELQDACESLQENNRQLLFELQEKSSAYNALREEIEKKDLLITSLQRNIHSTEKQKEDSTALNGDESSCLKLLLLEKDEELNSKIHIVEHLSGKLKDLQINFENSVSASQSLKKEIENRNKILDNYQKENIQLKSEIEALKNEIITVKEALDNSKIQVEYEQAQLEALCEELSNTSKEKIQIMSGISSTQLDSNVLIESLETMKSRFHNMLNFDEKQLEEKNLEIVMLRDSVVKLETSLQTAERNINFKNTQVDILFEELGSLISHQKKIESDLDVMQNLLLQKEKDLATFKEEPNTQMQFETNMERLQEELKNQKTIEDELKQKLRQMKIVLKATKNTYKNEREQWKLQISNLEKVHDLERTSFQKQIEVLSKSNYGDSVEDIDLTLIKNEILEAAKAFNLMNTEEFKKYNELVYSLLKKAVDIKLKHLQKKHEGEISTVNESWQQKIKNEFESKIQFESVCEKYKMEFLQLKDKLKESNKLNNDKDAFWQTKLTEIESILKINLMETHKKELLFLQSNLEELSKQKTLFEIKAKDLAHQVDMYKCQIENLQQQLDLAGEREKNLELKHKEEFANMCTLFETRWNNEMQKIVALQVNELEKLKNSKEKNVEAVCNHLFAEYGKKLKKLKEECVKITEEHYLSKKQYEASLQEMQQTLKKKCQDEKRDILLVKEKEIAVLTKALEEKEEVTKFGKCRNKEGEIEKQKIVTHYEKKLTELEQKLQNKYENTLQNHLLVHDATIRSIEETYNKKMEEVSELLKVATCAATASLHSDSGSNRTTTPSSDEACSSCKEDMLAENKLILADKIHQDGKRILNIIESSTAEAHLWLEERKWIVNKLKSLDIFAFGKQENLKAIISSLCDEILDARSRLKSSDQEIIALKRKCTALGCQIENITKSKLMYFSPNSSPKLQPNAEINSAHYLSTNEMIVSKSSPEESRLILSNSTPRNGSPQTNENGNSLSNELGHLRSADSSKSAQKFSTFLPEIGNSSPMKLNKTSEEAPLKSDISLLEMTEEIVQLPNENESPLEDMKQLKMQLSNAYNNSLSMPYNIGDANFASKLHGLYWVFRKSLSYNKSLIYQKKYLLMLLKGFQLTEKVTLTYVKNMEKNPIFGSESNTSSISADVPCHGKAHFRAVAFVAVAIHRMKYYVKRWRLLAKVPTLQVVDAEVQSIFQSYQNVSSLSPNGFNLSFLSLSSKSSTCESERNQYQNEILIDLNSSSASSVNSRTGSKSKRKPDNGQLCEIVQRLDMLQKQLGLDNLR